MRADDLETIMHQRLKPMIDLSDFMQEKALDDDHKVFHAMAVAMESTLKEVCQELEKIAYDKRKRASEGAN